MVNWISRLGDGATTFRVIEHVSLGFALGMFAMYISKHLYKWTGDKGGKAISRQFLALSARQEAMESANRCANRAEQFADKPTATGGD